LPLGLIAGDLAIARLGFFSSVVHRNPSRSLKVDFGPVSASSADNLS
jgi:hypothetical protein